ncbi:MAG: hypothetical protein MR296_02285 [Tenericutes bacterium]|nr:hypothetical protein [Mycoplasmatota bacterium]
MKKLNNVLIFLCSLAAVCFCIRDLNVGSYDRILGDVTVPFVLLIPRIMGKIFKIKITSAMELVYVLFIILAQFLGSVVNLYNKIWWYDLFAHFLSGILTSVLSLVVLNWFGVYNRKNKWFNFLFIISFTLMIASIWEFMEFGTDTFFGMNVQHSIETGVRDTMEDMLVAFLGSLIVSISYLVENKVAKNGFLKRVVSDLK